MDDLIKRMGRQLHSWELDEPFDDWWTYQKDFRNARDRIEAQEAEIARLRDWALQAFTIVEWCCGEGYLLAEPYFDCDDTYMTGVELLGIETAQQARQALQETANDPA